LRQRRSQSPALKCPYQSMSVEEHSSA
jgi:hypothetical protein